MSREACIKGLQAEGVKVSAAGAQFQCNAPAYHEAEWWHHMPLIADTFPGAEEVNRRGISLPYFTKDVPELGNLKPPMANCSPQYSLPLVLKQL